MKNFEIPLVKDRDSTYRWFERLPGILSWFTLSLPVILTLISPTLAAYFVIAYLLIWFVKAVALNVRVVQGYRILTQHMSYEWSRFVDELDNPDLAFSRYEQGINPRWHYKNLIAQKLRGPKRLHKNDIFNAVIIAVSIEGRDVIEPTIQRLLQSDYDFSKLIVFIGYEERCGKEVEKTVLDIVSEYKSQFSHMQAVRHPGDTPDEVIGKGANITFAGRALKRYVDEQSIDYEKVIVTTLDSDNRPHPQYFSAVTYAYLACPDPVHTSFQPISMFTNNIWDVPAPMRVIAASNSFWNIVISLRPHMLRNFAAHSQSMRTIVDTDFWSVRTIVEDGHQFWRTYFRYNGNHRVHPIMVPIYQDAVLASTYTKTLKAQFIQVRRWAWGASDIAYVLQYGWRKKNNVPKGDLVFKTARLIEGHTSWATASLILLLGAFVPLYLAPQASESLVANQLPIIASRIQTFATAGLFISIYYSIRLLPPKPARYKNRHRLYMLLQWVYMPITTILYSAFAALNSQTRLMFGRYLGKFDVTEKVVKK